MIEAIKQSTDYQTYLSTYMGNDPLIDYCCGFIGVGKLNRAINELAKLPRILPLSSGLKIAKSLAEAEGSLSTASFMMVSKELLVKLNQKNLLEGLNGLQLTLPLSESYHDAYKAVPKSRLALIDNQGSVEKQIAIMDLCNIQRATLRMKELIVNLSRSDKYHDEEYLELLALCILTKKVLQNYRMEGKAEVQNRASESIKIPLKTACTQKDTLDYFRRDHEGGKKLRQLARRYRDIIYVVPSSTKDFKSYVKSLKVQLVFNNLGVKTLTGETRERSFLPNTDSTARVTLISNRVLPSTLPKWPIVIDPHLEYLGSLHQHPQVIRYQFTQIKPDIVQACFGTGDLTVLQDAIKWHLKSVVGSRESLRHRLEELEQLSLTPEGMQKLNQMLTHQGAPHIPTITLDGVQLRRKEILKDGSCLFQCFVEAGIIAGGVTASRQKLSELLIENRERYIPLLGFEEVESIENELAFYSGVNNQDYEEQFEQISALQVDEAVLGDDYKEALFPLYVKMLKNTSMWGGYMELDAVANHFGKRIMINKLVNREVETISPTDNQFDGTIYLEHDGQHYTYLEPIG